MIYSGGQCIGIVPTISMLYDSANWNGYHIIANACPTSEWLNIVIYIKNIWSSKLWIMIVQGHYYYVKDVKQSLVN